MWLVFDWVESCSISLYIVKLAGCKLCAGHVCASCIFIHLWQKCVLLS